MNLHKHKAKRSGKKRSKRSTTKGRIEAERKKEALFGSLAILGIILAAIAGGWYLLQPKSQGEPPTEGEPTSPSVSQKHPGNLASDFSLTDLDGNAFKLSDFRGGVVVIDFMATWCGPCRQEMPHFETIWKKYKDKIVLMSIDIDPRESEETLSAFAQEFPYATWIWARDTANLGQDYQVTSIPKTVIIDQDGYIMFTHTGVTDASTFIQEIDQLIG